MNLSFEKTPVEGVFLLHSARRGDVRGSFMRLFCETEYTAWSGRGFFSRQVNLSATAQAGTVRGLHFQAKPALEGKVVRCLRGRVFDVAVDLRRGSPTFLKHVAVELDGAAGNALAIPPGCAHGFQSLSDDCEMLYLHSEDYAPAAEAGVAFDDPSLGIAWPLPVTVLSDRDRELPRLAPGFAGVDDAV